MNADAQCNQVRPAANSRGRRYRRVLYGLLVLMVPAAVMAQSAPEALNAAKPATPSKQVCVDAEVDGERALSYDCLNQQLAPAAVAGGPVAPNAAQALATAPSNRVGTFNYSAESIRFGSNWGKSVFPQRPAPVQPVPLR